VDVVNFPRYLSSLKRFQDVFQDGLDYAEEGEGEKSISELMVEQVEFANVVLLNKVDLVSEKKIQVTKRLVQTLNPKARVVEGSFGKIDLRYILNTNLFDMQEASESSGWLVSLKEGVNAAQGEADEYGVTSFVYRARKPFHPHRLHSFLKQFFCFAEEWNTADGSDTKGEADDEERMEERYGCILRSKGICWIAGRDEHEMGWAQCGRIIQLSPSSPWYCMAPEEEWEGTESEDDLEAIRAKFSGEYGDRRHEVVFIGTDMKQDAIEDELNKCVLTDEEMKFHSVALPVGTYPDPLLPNLVACEGSQSLFMIVRQDQDQHIRIFPGSCLTLQNLALTIKHEDDEDDIWAVKVWLDKSDSVKQGILLATLRPKSYEQHAMSLSLLPCDEEGGEKATNRRIRVEIIPRKGAKMKPDEWLMVCEVHVMGKVEPLPYSEDPDDEDDEIGDAADSTEDCEMGNCPM
jgi:G3E family GTPase